MPSSQGGKLLIFAQLFGCPSGLNWVMHFTPEGKVILIFSIPDLRKLPLILNFRQRQSASASKISDIILVGYQTSRPLHTP
jgi:hypothetical protein